MKQLLTFIGVGIMLCIFAAACDGDSLAGHDGMGTMTDSLLSEMPSMVTYDVSMLVSDSGIIRYRATTPAWYNYDRDPSRKQQRFPEGINIVQLDSLLQPTASIDADSAINDMNKNEWHLMRNVVIRNLQDEEFRTEELFWDMNRHRVYSDSFIHIERPDAIIEGYGFSSTDDFTRYELRQTSGIFPMRDPDAPAGGGAEARSDTASAQPTQ